MKIYLNILLGVAAVLVYHAIGRAFHWVFFKNEVDYYSFESWSMLLLWPLIIVFVLLALFTITAFVALIAILIEEFRAKNLQ